MFDAAAKHVKDENRCDAEANAIVARVKGETLSAREAALHSHTIECRWTSLNLKDRLLATLSPERANGSLYVGLGRTRQGQGSPS